MRTILTPVLALSLGLGLALPRSAAAEAPATATAPSPEDEWRRAYRRERLIGSLEAAALTTAWAGATGATLWAGLHVAETSEERGAMGIRILGSTLLTALPVLAATSDRHPSSSSGALNALDDLARLAMAVVAPPMVGLSTWGIGQLTRASHRPGLGFLGATGGAAFGLAGCLMWQGLVAEIVDRSDLLYWVMQVANVVMVNSMANLGYFLASGGPR